MHCQRICHALFIVLWLIFMAPHAEAKVAVGDPAPAADLLTWDGSPVRLGDFRGKVVVIDFWASWCGICREALPSIDAVGRRFAGTPLIVIGINVDQAQRKAEQFLAEYLPGAAMTLLRDPQADTLARFGAEGMPAIYVVDPTGVVRFAESGYSADTLTAVERTVARYLPASPAAAPEQAARPPS